jgi:iron complex transport system substrate-binding protein
LNTRADIGLGLVLLSLAVSAGRASAAPRVMSLDQCADQYVMMLAPRETIVGVSYRAADQDSFLRTQAVGLPRRRATAEAVLAAQPQVVVRYWGGDALLSRVLVRQKVAVVDLSDEGGFDGVRRNVRAVAAALGEQQRGEQVIMGMDTRLAASAGAWHGKSAIYLTPGGFSAGTGTMIDAMLRAAGLTNQTKAPGYVPAPSERLLLEPPTAVVLGFFDRYGLGQQGWVPGRRGPVRRLVDQRAIASLPGRLLDCPAWFAADGVRAIARGRGRS